MITTTNNVLTWEYFKLKVKQHLNIDFVKVDDFFREGTKWFTLEDWLNTDDLDILHCLESLYPFEGKLIIVTDASYKKDLGPFIVEANRINEFIENHYKNYNEYFLDTDVIIINLEKKLVWIFHHEGIYSIIHFD